MTKRIPHATPPRKQGDRPSRSPAATATRSPGPCASRTNRVACKRPNRSSRRTARIRPPADRYSPRQAFDWDESTSAGHDSLSCAACRKEWRGTVRTSAELSHRLSSIETLAKSMDSLTFAEESLDLIWSEGAIYNMGFGKGIEAWRPFLRSGGVLAVSEITWLRPNPRGNPTALDR